MRTEQRHLRVPVGCLVAALVWGGCHSDMVDPAQDFSQTDQLIVNGTAEPQSVTLTPGEMLAVGWLHPAGRPGQNFCSATLIAPDAVVTARHCVLGSRPSDIAFGVGPRPSDPDASFGASAIYTHPSADAAVILLSTDATQEVEGLTPIAANREALVGEDLGVELDAAGYGDTYNSNPEGRWFALVYLYEVTSDEIIVDGRGEQGICYGDSGGPVMWNDDEGRPVVLAVESWGDDSCVGRDHMTRLDPIIDDFIDPVLAGEVPEDPCLDQSFLGRCDGDVAERCSRRSGLVRTDCASLGTSCDFISEDVGYGCTCGNVDFLGRCDGDVVEYCDDGRLRQIDCGSFGGFCSYVDGDTGFFCTQDAPQECPAGTEQGTCEGDTLVLCSAGETTRLNCDAAGGQCVADGAGARCAEGGDNPDPGDDPVVDPIDDPFPDIPGGEGDGVSPVDPAGNPSDSGCRQAGTTSAPSPLWLLAMLGLVWRRRRG